MTLMMTMTMTMKVTDDEEDTFKDLLDMFGRSGKSIPQASLTLTVDSTLPAQTAPLPERMVTIARPEGK